METTENLRFLYLSFCGIFWYFKSSVVVHHLDLFESVFITALIRLKSFFVQYDSMNLTLTWLNWWWSVVRHLKMEAIREKIRLDVYFTHKYANFTATDADCHIFSNEMSCNWFYDSHGWLNFMLFFRPIR